MATANGLFNVKLEISDTLGSDTWNNGWPLARPLTQSDNFLAVPVSGVKYSTTSWDIAVHEVTWSVNPTFIENADELRGYTSAPWHDGAGSMAATITAKARVRPKMLGLLCYLATGGKVTTKTSAQTPDHASNAITAGAYEHAFTYNLGDTPQTATIHFAPTKGQGFKLSGCGLTSLAFSFEASGALIADMAFSGLYFVESSEQITPSYETAVPLKKSQFSFVGDGLFSEAGSKATDINWTVTNNLDNFFSFGAASIWPDAIEYADLWATVGGSVTKRQVLATDYERWISKGSTGHFLECIRGVGDFLGTNTSGSKFSFYTHIPAAQWLNMNPDAITNKRRIGVSMDWEARSDADATGDYCNMFVVNDQANSVFTAAS